MHPVGGTFGHARLEPSERGAAIISVMYERHQRLGLAEELAGAFCGRTFAAEEEMAERGSGESWIAGLNGWRIWRSRAAGTAQIAPLESRDELVAFMKKGRS